MCERALAAIGRDRMSPPETPVMPIRLRIPVAVLFMALLSGAAGAQRPDSVQRADTTPRTQAPKPPEPAKTPQLDFSGIIFANWNYRTDRGARAQNRFDLERAYLTFRMPAGERASVRITADVFQNTTAPGNAFYRGWAFRAKYAYLQYEAVRGTGLTAAARLGILQTVAIEHIESFWPRWLSRTAIELNGFFQSADVGLAAQMGLPNKRGEIYATVTNGPGYSSRETDRFKGCRGSPNAHPLREAIGAAAGCRALGLGVQGRDRIALRERRRWTDWLSRRGAAARPLGPFCRAPRPSVDPWRRARPEDRGRRAREQHRREPARRHRQHEYARIRLRGRSPARAHDAREAEPLAAVVRYDRTRFNDDTGPAQRLIIAGLILDITSRLSMAADFQQLLPRDGAPGADTKTWFAHVVASF